jgi:hypothetical protein
MIDPEQALEHGWKGFVNVSYISDIPVRMIASPGKITNYTIQLELIPHVPEFTETLIALDPGVSSKSGAGWGDPAPIFNDYIRYSPSGLMRLSVEHPLNVTMSLYVPEGRPFGMSGYPQQILGVGIMADVPVVSAYNAHYNSVYNAHYDRIPQAYMLTSDLAPWIDSTEYREDLEHYSIAVGTQNPSEIVSVRIYPPINSKLDFKLIRIDTIPSMISNKTITVIERNDSGVLWSVELPDDAPAMYRFGVIVHTLEGETLRLISTLRVPIQILKASLELDKSEYKIGEKPVMNIVNHGATTLNFGTYYWYERLDEGEWVHIEWGERAWTAPILILDPNRKYQEKLDVPFSDEGIYRVAKEITAEGTNITRIFYADFVCAGFIARAYASEGVPLIEELFWKIGFPLILVGLYLFIQKKILRNIDERSK